METIRQPAPTGEAAAPADSRRDASLYRRLMLAAWISAGLATLLVFSELLAAGFAVTWAVGYSMHLGATSIWVVAGLGAGACLWIAVKFFRSALQGEKDLIPPHQGEK